MSSEFYLRNSLSLSTDRCEEQTDGVLPEVKTIEYQSLILSGIRLSDWQIFFVVIVDQNFYFRDKDLQTFADFWRPIVILDGSLW
jgi:hypothetical protein